MDDIQSLLMGKLYYDRDGDTLAELSLLNCALTGHPVHAIIRGLSSNQELVLRAEKTGDHSLWTTRIRARKDDLISSFESLKSSLKRLEENGLPEGRLKELKEYLIRSSVMARENNIFSMADTLLTRSLGRNSVGTPQKLISCSEDDFNQFLRSKLKPSTACLVFDLSKNSKGLARKLNIHR